MQFRCYVCFEPRRLEAWSKTGGDAWHDTAEAPGRTTNVMWSNLHLLFWLTLFPFGTGWMDQSHFAARPTAVYGFVLLMAAIAYWYLQRNILRLEGPSSALHREIGTDLKGKISPFLYLAGIGLAFVKPWLGCTLYVFVAAMWIVPDRRIERALGRSWTRVGLAPSLRRTNALPRDRRYWLPPSGSASPMRIPSGPRM